MFVNWRPKVKINGGAFLIFVYFCLKIYNIYVADVFLQQLTLYPTMPSINNPGKKSFNSLLNDKSSAMPKHFQNWRNQNFQGLAENFSPHKNLISTN